jgi:hypothetical protein
LNALDEVDMISFAKRIIEGPDYTDGKKSAESKKSSAEKARAAFARKRSVGKMSSRKGSMSGTRTVKDHSEEMELTNPFKFGSDIDSDSHADEEEKEPAHKEPHTASEVTRDLNIMFLGDMTLSNQQHIFKTDGEKSPKVRESPMKMLKKD